MELIKENVISGLILLLIQAVAVILWRRFGHRKDNELILKSYKETITFERSFVEKRAPKRRD